jgi:hydroxyacylglutathione hydrolase
MSEIHVESNADRLWGTNSYLVEDESTRDAVIVDANFEPALMLDLVRRRGSQVRAIILTHTDQDHIAGLAELLAAHPVPVAVHGAEREVLTEGRALRPPMPSGPPLAGQVDDLTEGDTYRAGSLAFEVLHTPGHSPGGVTFRIGNALFTGDALFAGSIGRTDFPNCDHVALLTGITTKLMAFPDDFLVFSGHGAMTTIGQERRYNPFL